MDSVDYVFNAAALKQVPSCEFNPFEAVKTNVIGTQNIIEVAMETGVEKVILVSTDKVVNPINTMGTTKLLAEKLMRSANFYKGPRENCFFLCSIWQCTWYAWICDSTISITVENSNPITLTHKKMTRFVMTLPKRYT